jgi:hypothetical protein
LSLSGKTTVSFNIDISLLPFLTTVGYGDVVPKSAFGKLIASGCAITGVCLLAMLIPILVNNFLLFFTHSKVLEKRGKAPVELI